MEKLSAVITTFNNARTLDFCLKSVHWADELLILDSYSTDETLEIAKNYNAHIVQHKFLGYGAQKQMAVDQASHKWVVLLDADEALSPELQQEIQDLLQTTPTKAGYVIPRLEQAFWRMANSGSRLNEFLRLFEKTKTRLGDMPVHAAPETKEATGRLKGVFYHFGETSIHTKVDKINSYSTGLVVDKLKRGKRGNPWMMVIYPPYFFFQNYLFKRNFLNGWAGFIGSVSGAYYVFLKYAKLYEHRQFERYGTSLLPAGAPRPETTLTPK